MLSVATPFPNVGAPAFLKVSPDNPEPKPCRILQHNRDGSFQIAIIARYASASNTKTVQPNDVVATFDEALPATPRRAAKSKVAAPAPVKVPRQRPARKPRR